MMIRTSFGVIAISALLWAGSAAAVEGTGATVADAKTAQRLDRLEADASALDRALGAGEVQVAQAMQSSVAGDFELRLQRLESMMQDLTGRVEEENHKVSQLQDKIDRMSGDFDYRLQQIEKGGKGSDAPPVFGGAQATNEGPAPAKGEKSGPKAPDKPTAPTPPAAPAGGEALAMTGNAQTDYDHAFSLLGKSDLPAAEKAFQTYVQHYPKNPLAGNAQYWLGETYYGRKMFPQAVAAFGDAFKSFPTGSKAPDSLLKLGMSFAQLGKKAEACTAYTTMLQRFANASPNTRKVAEAESKKLACGK